MAGTVEVTSRDQINIGKRSSKVIEKIVIDATADAADGSFPAFPISLNGYVLKVVTNPGSVAPQDNYDIYLYDPDDAALDAMALTLENRDTANGECVYPVGTSGAATPIFLCGTYSLEIKNNNVNSATTKIVFYLADSL